MIVWNGDLTVNHGGGLFQTRQQAAGQRVTPPPAPTGGLFWCLREDFEAIGGFNEDWLSVEDLDFAKRLKAHGRKQGKRFKTITKAHIVTSCRKFDLFGDWYLIRNPGFVWRIFTGKSRNDADEFYCDVRR